MTFRGSLACFGLLIAACSGDEGAPAPAGSPDAGAGGSAEASAGGGGGAVSTGGVAGDTQEAGVAGSGGSGTGGTANSGGADTGGGSSTGGANTGGGPNTGGDTGVPEGGAFDASPDVAAPDAAGDAEAAVPCLLPRVACPGACVDLSNDPLHCGDCSHACGAREACTNGACVAAHCGSALGFSVEPEYSILSAVGGGGGGVDGGGASDGGASNDGGGSVDGGVAADGTSSDAGTVSVPNRLLLAAGTGGTMDAWVAASDGVYRAAGTTGTTMLSTPSLALAGSSQSLAVAKLDSDGVFDIVSDSPTDVALYLGGSPSGYSLAGAIGLGAHVGSVLAVDIDGDQQNEIVVAALQDNLIVVSIYKVPPLDQPILWRAASVPLGGSLDVYGLSAGDFDQNGYRDIALAAYGSVSGASFGALVTLTNTATELSDPVVHALPEGRVRSPLVFDFNGDGFDDVVAVAGRSIHFFAGSSAGLPPDPLTTTPELSFSYADAAAADFDRDGKLDLALVRRVPPSGNQVVLAWGDGSGAFVPDFSQAIALPSVSGIAAGDVNDDGRPDLVVVSAARGSITGIRNECN